MPRPQTRQSIGNCPSSDAATPSPRNPSRRWCSARRTSPAEDNVRQGFLEPEQYERLLTELPGRLKALLVVAYHTGARKGELLSIRWPQVDLDAHQIRLSAAQTKNKRARVLPIYGDMERWIKRQREEQPEGCQWLFSHHRLPVGHQLAGWSEACVRAGLPGLLFHDLRRSAVRNLKRAGVGDKVAMEISGHRTRAIFDRYRIVDDSDLKDAAAKMEAWTSDRKRARAAKLRRVK